MVKILTKSVKVNLRNKKQNKKYKSRIKTFTRKCLYFGKKYLIETNTHFYMLIKKNFNLAFQALDKCQKINIFHSNTIARKKSK
jgi:small subunit ribosomal protein S20